MIVKKHVAGGRLILAVCDSDISGKKFTEGKLEIDLSSNFYSGTETAADEVKKLMKSSYIINLVGKDSLKTARELVAIDENNVIFIQGVPHAQVLFVPLEE